MNTTRKKTLANTRARARILSYLIAIAGPLLVVTLNYPPTLFIEGHTHLILFAFPIILAAYWGGGRSGLLATATSAILAAWALMPPLGSLSINSPHDRMLWLVLTGNGVLMSLIAEGLHRDRRKAERAVALEQQLNTIARTLPGALFVFERDQNGNSSFPLTNENLARVLGFKDVRALDDVESAFGHLHPDDAPGYYESVLASERELSPWRYSFRVIHPDRDPIWIEAFSTPERLSNGATRWAGFAHDITEQKLAEEKAETLAERWQFAMEASEIGVWEWDITQNRILFSPSWKHMLGYTTDEFTDDPALWFSLIHPDDAERVSINAKKSWDDANPEGPFEYRLRRKDGSYIWVLSRRMVAARDAAGKPTRFVGTHTDVTALKQSAEALVSSEARVRAYFENSPIAIFILSPDGRYLDCNLKALQMLGYSRAEVQTMHVGDFGVHPERARAALAQLNQGVTVRVSHDLLTRDGQIVRAESHGAKLPDGNFVVFHIDVSAEHEATKSLHLQSAALEAAANSIVITDARGKITWVNSAFCKSTGYTRGECIGKNSRDLVKSGAQGPDFYKALWSTISNNRVWRGQLINRKKNGDRVTEEMTITPVRDEHGVLTNFIAIKQDITERLEMEQRLYRTQRLESVGRLASGIAHDLNNILTPVLMAPPLLREAIKDPEMQSLVDSIEASVTRGAAIIRQLLLFGRGKDGPREPVSMRTLMREMEEIARQTFPKNISVTNEAADDLALVMGDSTQLHQVVMNLAVNARDAMPNGGQLSFRTSTVSISQKKADGIPGAAPGPYIRIDVKDTGSGVDPKHLDKLFDPYFTTKKSGEGTGLGLSTSMAIVRAHEGFITATSQPGHGSLFSVWLPALSSGAFAPRAHPQSAMPRGSGEHVLIVDDEPDIRNVLCRMLQQNGYNCTCFPNGADALEFLTKPGPPVRILLTDILMPKMDGRTLSRLVHERYPDVLIVTMTGYDTSQDEVEAEGAQGSGVLAAMQKPLSAKEVLTTLHQLLHPAQSGAGEK